MTGSKERYHNIMHTYHMCRFFLDRSHRQLNQRLDVMSMTTFLYFFPTHYASFGRKNTKNAYSRIKMIHRGRHETICFNRTGNRNTRDDINK